MSKTRLDNSVKKLFAEEIAKGQLKVINQGLQPPNLFSKASVIDLCQLFVDIGSQSSKNIDVRDAHI